jgi:hypothetical protein
MKNVITMLEGDDGIMEFDGLMNMEQNELPMGPIVGSNDTMISSTPMEKGFCTIGHYNARDHK